MPFSSSCHIGESQPEPPCLVVHSSNNSIKGILIDTRNNVFVIHPGTSAMKVGEKCAFDNWQILPKGSTITLTQE